MQQLSSAALSDAAAPDKRVRSAGGDDSRVHAAYTWANKALLIREANRPERRSEWKSRAP